LSCVAGTLLVSQWLSAYNSVASEGKTNPMGQDAEFRLRLTVILASLMTKGVSLRAAEPHASAVENSLVFESCGISFIVFFPGQGSEKDPRCFRRHGHGHGHGIFILATHPSRRERLAWNANANVFPSKHGIHCA
jgi:hypothetical protein